MTEHTNTLPSTSPSAALADHRDALTHGLPPLTGRTEPWMDRALGDPDLCAALLAEHGSPVNLHDFTPLARNAAELTDSASTHGVAARVFVARKANRTVGLVRAAAAAGLGVDVASLGELDQCLAVGLSGGDLVVSAAVKSEALLTRALEAGAAISIDNRDELDDVVGLAGRLGVVARAALRLAVVDDTVAPTRFGLPAATWLTALENLAADRSGSAAVDAVRIEGVHFHLNGYSAADRATALRAACALVDELAGLGHRVSWVDMGGGVPMSYLESGDQWRAFWAAVDAQPAAERSSAVTWRGDRLGLVDPNADRPSPALYPYHQSVVRGQWLDQVLSAPGDGDQRSVAQMLGVRGLELRCEPGRSVLDGCGMTLASVAFRKESSDGIGLVGLHMNRTQVRSTSADFLVDPVMVRPTGAGDPSPAGDGFLVGAYCIEEELLLRRRLAFPRGVARGDVFAFVNTGGYLMHIVESASHQLPLALNLVASAGQWSPDQ